MPCAARVRKRLTRLMLPLLGLLLLPAVLLAASSPHADCPANFGNQALFKNIPVPVGREVILRCKIRDWNHRRCGPKKAVRWRFNGTELRREVFIPGFQVRSVRLRVAVFTALNEGIYTCTLPNGQQRRFNVTARSAYDSRRLRDLLPQNEAHELPGRVYWLPAILNTQQRYVSDRSENSLEPFMCHFYVQGNRMAVNWTFQSVIADEPMLLPVEGPKKALDHRRPSVDIITRNISCDAFVVKIGWRPRAPKGRCYNTYLVFRVVGDQEVGDYTCSVAGSDRRRLSMNFKMDHNLPSQQWIKHPKKAATVGKSTSEKVPPVGRSSVISAPVRTMASLNFNRDERECIGRNFTFMCNVRPAEYGLALYRRVPNASESMNYSLKLLAKSPEEDLLQPQAAGDETTPSVSLFRLISFTGKLRYTLLHVTPEDSGVYQCCTRNPYSFSHYVQREMRLTVEDCSQPVNWLFSSPHVQLIVAVVFVVVLLPIALSIAFFVYRRLFTRKALLHRRVVVVHPSANRGYPPFLHRRFSSSDNIDSLRSNSGETCSGGSSCLTPSSTLDSTASPGGGNGSLSPLRAPDVCVHSLRRTLRFTRPSDSGGGASEALVAPLRPPDVRVQSVRRPMRFPRASLSSGSTRWVRSRSSNLTYELPDQQAWEITRHRVSRGEQIGEGAFGVVFSGFLTEPDGHGRRQVAIKMLREDFSEEELMDLIKEMEVMKLLEPHRHIISLLGVCTRDGPLCLVNEFAPHGNLRDFLRERRPKPGESASQRLNRLSLPRGLLTYQHLIDFGLQVASGLEYLASLSVVHRDIAARNVLVGEAFEAKIADFGMSRCVANYYRKTTEGRLPVKWLAPEALFDHIFTRQGDVWSFGILLWEIFSLGGTPYPAVPVERLFGLLRQGHRNDAPVYAFPAIYNLMQRCWSEQPHARPSFTELRVILENMRGVEEYAEILRDLPYSELAAASCSYISMEA